MMRRFPRVMLVLVVLTVSAGLVFAAKTCPSCGAANKDSDKFCKSCGAKLPSAPPPQPSTPKVSGSVAVDGPVVRVTSDPSGAVVNVDGHNQGRTPLELDAIEPGRHQLELARSGYRSYYGEFTITGRFGSIVVTTEPVGAEVLLDDKSRGPAPDGGLVLAKVPYGRHTITARLAGYDDAVKTVDLKAAGPLGVTCHLDYGKGWLVVNSDPPGASLAVNDSAVGKTPFGVELEPARYALSLTHRGYFDWTGDASVQHAESTSVQAILDRMQTRKLPLLVAALLGLGAGGAAAVKGQSEYALYKSATSREDAERYHRSTAKWDLTRTVALGAGLVLGVAYWTVKW
jgi:hypothetical protein